MRRILHTPFLVLLMLFLGGYSRAYAHSKASLCIHTSSQANHLPHEHLFVRPASSQSEKQNQDFALPILDNEEDDEFSSFKKQLVSGNLPTSILFSQLAWPFFTSPNKIQSFSYTPSKTSSWYLVLQVFRL